MSVVEEYLQCLGGHDWEGLARTIVEEGLHRDGPFCDVVEGKAAYLKFLEQIVDSLPNYVLKVARVSPVGDRLVYVELSETFDVNGVLTEYPECIVFETAEDGLIRDVSVFMKYPGAEAPVEGGRAG
ncbi:MAG TPA: nuclear transport factor 2 family protein [Acidimicrobiales bacterium]|nr:nuclear transport factor 2 family protein [Acidimicrobiales bacterium]